MTNNFIQIRKLLNFRSDDDFYFLQILQRKKENPDLPKSVRVIDIFYIDSFESFDKYRQRIIDKCEAFKARAYINLNRRSYKQVALETLKQAARLISEENYKPIKNIYNSACGQASNEKGLSKKWIIDIDDKNFNIDGIKESLKKCNPGIGEDKILNIIPTNHGFHIITTPFAVNEFNKYYFEVTKRCWNNDFDLHKNNPTILYAYTKDIEND